MESFRDAYRGQWKRPLVIASVLVLAAIVGVVWTTASAEHIRTFHPTFYRIWTDQRTLMVYPDNCHATFTSVREDETSTAVRVYVRGKDASNGSTCADVIVHLHRPLDHRAVLDGSTGKAMRRWR